MRDLRVLWRVGLLTFVMACCDQGFSCEACDEASQEADMVGRPRLLLGSRPTGSLSHPTQRDPISGAVTQARIMLNDLGNAGYDIVHARAKKDLALEASEIAISFAGLDVLVTLSDDSMTEVKDPGHLAG